MTLAASIAEVEELQAQEKEANQQALTDELMGMADESLVKLVNAKGLIKKLTKVQIASILLKFYEKSINPSRKSKPELIQMLRPLISSNRNALGPVGADADLPNLDQD